MKHQVSLVAAALGLAILAACSTAPTSPTANEVVSTYTPPATPAIVKDGILVDNSGITLYTYDKDIVPNKSTCYAKCPFVWPPLLTTPDDVAKGDFTIFERDDGMTQWAYKGKPLYQNKDDKKPGDHKGDGKADWKIAKP
jgi:predicted lipoprotein with Yx(FWY)xxD motif